MTGSDFLTQLTQGTHLGLSGMLVLVLLVTVYVFIKIQKFIFKLFCLLALVAAGAATYLFW